jgi:hypothetical protein
VIDDCKECLDLATDAREAGIVKQELESAPVVRDAKVIDTSDDRTQYRVRWTGDRWMLANYASKKIS